jgi:uncharacterized protein (DUF362 family)
MRDTAAIVGLGDDLAAALSEALDVCGFWERLAAARRGPRVLIKPDLTGHAEGSAAATSPRLVEALIDLLHERGCGDVAVAAAADASGAWLENREPPVAAELLGYGYVTPGGRAYEVLDLAEDAEPGAFPAHSALADEPLSRAWRTADVRIVFAKNRTDQGDAYALSLASLIDVLPGEDKTYAYRGRHDPADCAAALLTAAPIDLALIDAGMSAHGAGGAVAPKPVKTATLIAARDPRLADLVGAVKMGLDPYASQLFAGVCRRAGAPKGYAVVGDLAPYRGWKNVPPVLVEASRARAKSLAAERTVPAWLQAVDDGLFPFREALDAKANALLAPLAAQLDDEPALVALLAGASHLLGWTGQAVFAGQVLGDKDAIRRSEAPVPIDPADVSEADFAAVVADAGDWLPLLDGLEPGKDGLKFRRVGGAVIFQVSRETPFPFAVYAARFEVHRAIQLMNDYIGGQSLAVARDARGRPTRQIERNLYLPQPNYIALSGGPVIDVTKLEVAEYGPGAHRMWWKTVGSENGSATADDGLVEVVAARRGRATRVTISGRQAFVLPPLAEALKLHLQPELQAKLTAQAYGVFAERTFANFEAVVEGRDPRIGRDWALRPADDPRPVEQLARWIEQAQAGEGPFGFVADWMTAKESKTQRVVDELGFTHVRPASAPALPPPEPPDDPDADAPTEERRRA